jgi:hypothetical protein
MDCPEYGLTVRYYAGTGRCYFLKNNDPKQLLSPPRGLDYEEAKRWMKQFKVEHQQPPPDSPRARPDPPKKSPRKFPKGFPTLLAAVFTQTRRNRTEQERGYRKINTENRLNELRRNHEVIPIRYCRELSLSPGTTYADAIVFWEAHRKSKKRRWRHEAKRRRRNTQ